MALADQSLTVAEAAFVTGHSVRSVNHEIDGGIIAIRDPAARRLGDADLLYLGAVRDLRPDLGLSLRRQFHDAIVEAVDRREPSAQIGYLSVALDAVEDELAGRLRTLHRLHTEDIEQRADILSGEPVLAGTRIPARHVADMMRQGATEGDLADAFDLTPAQVAAAVLFDRVSPRQGRPPRTSPLRVSAA